VVYCLSDLGAPWGLRVDGSATAKFHLVLDGRATLTLDEPGAAPAELSAGALALLPHGSAHLIQDDRDSPARPLEHILAELPAEAAERLNYGGDGPRTSLLCGGFALASGLPERSINGPGHRRFADGSGVHGEAEVDTAVARVEPARGDHLAAGVEVDALGAVDVRVS